MKNIKIFSKVLEIKKLKNIDHIINDPNVADYIIRLMPNFSADPNCITGLSAVMGKKVVPELLGNDIGCGILVVELGKVNIDTDKLDKVIREKIPFGRNIHKKSLVKFFPDDEENPHPHRFDRCIGTLGGGYHFIEIDRDENDNKYLIIHSGSRGYGLKLRLSVNWANFATESEKRKFFYDDLDICLKFASENRKQMANIIMDNMHFEEKGRFDIFHNYAENRIFRKGAISARDNERVIIPINEIEGCILGFGKGNRDWNYSAPSNANGIIDDIEPTVEIEKIIRPIYNFNQLTKTSAF